MAMLRTEANIGDPDALYSELIELHRGLSEEQSRMANAKLILLLANHVGDMAVLRQAIAVARESL
jgi:3-(3-hydroxy-phenyl)propionate hydroxylase